MNPVLLVDATSLLYRAHYIAPPAPQGLRATLAALCAEHAPRQVWFARDDPAPTFRAALAPQYKRGRGRTPQAMRRALAELDPVLDELGDGTFRAPGFEADDVLATLARRLRQRGVPGLVVTCDRDLLALAFGGVEVLLLGHRRGGQGQRFDAAAVRRRHGVPPELLGAIQALKGKRDDGLPGVPGLHPRDAARLLREHGSVAALLDALERVRPPTLRRLLEDHAAAVRHNAAVLPLRDDVPLPDAPIAGS